PPPPVRAAPPPPPRKAAAPPPPKIGVEQAPSETYAQRRARGWFIYTYLPECDRMEDTHNDINQIRHYKSGF
ncbi:MAG: hypothetical protein HQK53_20315, partial [Oligoflexia bacterium]|nr:hypothetical protein [Oligoflexia bacterium]